MIARTVTEPVAVLLDVQVADCICQQNPKVVPGKFAHWENSRCNALFTTTGVRLITPRSSNCSVVVEVVDELFDDENMQARRSS